MNARSVSLKVGVIALLAVAASYAAIGCGGDDNSGTPTIDAGNGADSTASSSGSMSDSGSGTGDSATGATPDAGTGDATSGVTPDAGNGTGGDSGNDGSVGSAGGDACAPTGNSTFNACPYAATITCLPYNNAEAGVPSPLPTM